jgi:alkanesulfonate monooxygenase SsuD/methylene tetrahydromethanopterin reductase-like flavin-dependent oxidoreductase (luciferase family)
MVIVLPWHNPVRVAEDIVMLDTLLGPDRKGMYGVGRGAGRREFKGLGIDMAESKGRFYEELEVIKAALTEDRFSYEGEFYSYEDVELRPKPRDAQRIIDQLYISWISRSTVASAGPTGLKPIVIPQKPWTEYIEELGEFSQLREEAGYEPSPPIVAMTLYCGETEEEARAGADRYFPEYGDSALRNYELKGKHFAGTKGYEEYAKLSDKIQGQDDVFGDLFLENHIWGTPEQCIAKIQAFAELIGPSELVFFCRYGTMGHEEAMKNMELFAKEVLPAVNEIPTSAVKVG